MKLKHETGMCDFNFKRIFLLLAIIFVSISASGQSAWAAAVYYTGTTGTNGSGGNLPNPDDCTEGEDYQVTQNYDGTWCWYCIPYVRSEGVATTRSQAVSAAINACCSNLSAKNGFATKGDDAVTEKIVPCSTEWLYSLISQFESEPVTNPPRLIYKYDHGEQTFYYVPPYAADQYSTLYDACGKVVCKPDGGITGAGDGNCPDFTNIADLKNDEVFWADNRVSLTINKPIGGTVISNVPTTYLINYCGIACKKDYALNTLVTLTATPDAGFIFKNWTGDCAGTNATATVKMDATKTCTVNFVKPIPKTASFKIGRFNVTNAFSSKSGSGSGSVCLPVGCQIDKSGNHPNGYSVSVTTMNSPGGGYSNSNSVSQNKDGQWCLNSSVKVSTKKLWGGGAWYEGTHAIYGMCPQ